MMAEDRYGEMPVRRYERPHPALVASHYVSGVQMMFSMETDAVVQSQLFDATFDLASTALVLLDHQGRMLKVNGAFAELLGYAIAKLLGKPLLDFLHPADREQLQAQHGQALPGSLAGLPLELRYRHRDGQYLRGRLTANAVSTRNAVPEYLLAQVEDLSHRLALEERLTLMNFTLSLVHEAAYLIDQHSCFRYVNDEACRALGYSREELLGMTVADIDPDWTNEQVLVLWHSIQEQPAEIFETQHRTKDGHIFPVEISATHIKLGGQGYSLSLARDISERKRLQAAQRESQRRYREVFDNSSDCLYLLEVTAEQRFRYIQINAAFEQTTGFSREQLIGRYLGESSVAETARKVLAQLTHCLACGENIEWEEQLELPAGVIAAHSTFIPVRDEQGRIYRIVGISRNISAMRAAERHLKESHAQLRRLASHRETAREEERKRIAREIHDELGQQLTALRMGISLLRLQFGKHQPALVERVQALMTRVDETIQVVRNVATSLRPAALDMGLTSALEWLVSEFSQHSGIACQLAAPAARLQLDDERATAAFRVIQESLTNVARHAHASRVEINLECDAEHFLIEVRDNGKGCDPGHQRKGTLGLLGMRERGHMLGGEVAIDSAPGQGTCVRVRIPIQTGAEKP